MAAHAATDAPYPVDVEAELAPGLSRWLWLVKWLLVLPHVVCLAFLWLAFVVTTALAWFAILFTGRFPRGLFDLNLGVLRWTWRVGYYSYSALGTDRYPPFSLGEEPDYPARLDVPYPEHLSRGLALVKWWLLALPHYLVIAVFAGSAWGAWHVGGGLIALHGSTRQVADAIASAIEPGGHEVEVRPARAVADPGAYDAVVLGAPLYMGRWHKDARAFVRRHRQALERLPVAIFALGPIDDDLEHWKGSEQQLDKALASLPEVDPVDVKLFGGAIEPEELHFPFSRMPAADVRDWVAIRAWGAGLPERLGLPAYASSSSPWAIA